VTDTVPISPGHDRARGRVAGKVALVQLDAICRSNTAAIEERDASIKEVVGTVSEVVNGFKGHGERHTGKMEKIAAEFDTLSRLEDVNELRRRLHEDVATLKDSVKEMRRESEESVRHFESQITSFQQRLEMARTESRFDRLTGLGSRRDADQQLRQISKRPSPVCVLLFDVEGFREINRVNGTPFGDKLLQALAHTLSDYFPENDTLFRWGADEFLAIAEGRFRGPIFSPRRANAVPPRIDWPKTRTNATLEDFDQMTLQQFGGCSQQLLHATGAPLTVRANYGSSILPLLFGVQPCPPACRQKGPIPKSSFARRKKYSPLKGCERVEIAQPCNAKGPCAAAYLLPSSIAGATPAAEPTTPAPRLPATRRRPSRLPTPLPCSRRRKCWMKWNTEEAADGPPAVLRIVVVFSMVSVFWGLYYQNSSTWVEQAKAMNLSLTVPAIVWEYWAWPGSIVGALFGALWLFLWVANRPLPRRTTLAGLVLLGLWGLGAVAGQLLWGGMETITMLPAQISAANPLFVMMVIPLLNVLVYRPLERRGRPLKPLHRMAVGLFLASLAFVTVALLQTRIVAMGRGEVHVLWQVIPYFILTTAEVLVSVTGLEFAYTQAPRAMKSTIMGFWLLTFSFGNMLVAFLAPLQELSLATFFWIFAGLMAVAAVVFVVLAARYRGKTYLQQN